MSARERIRQAYERGRAQAAVGRAMAAVPFGLVGAVVLGEPGARLGAALGLGLLAGWLYFRGGAAGRAVNAGLAAAVVPFALPLLVRGSVCPMGACATWCIVACSVGGIAAGAWLGARSMREPDGVRFLAVGAALAAAAAAIGCTCAGAGGIVGMIGGIAIGAPSGRWLRTIAGMSG